MDNIARRLIVLFSSSLAGVSITHSAMAQSVSDSAVPVNSLKGVQSWRALEGDRLEITFEDGRVVILQSDQFTLVEGMYYIESAELDALGISIAWTGLSTGQWLLSAGQLAGMVGLGFVGDSDVGGSQSSQTSSQTSNGPIFTSGLSASGEEGVSSAYDADATSAEDAAITYSLSGTDAALFDIDAGTGVVTFRTEPDFETPADADSDNNYEFTVTASDGTTSTVGAVTVSVTNVNDSLPVFISDSSVLADENQTAVYQAVVSDADGDPITFSLSGPDADLFTIDPDTGVVTFITSPDYENPGDADGDNNYEFTVIASDGVNSTDDAVTVTVTDVNDSLPVFISDSSVMADENQTAVYQAVVSDADGDPITFSLSGPDADLFTIDPDTGVVTFITPPDYENSGDVDGDNVYEFTVTANDGVNSIDDAVTVTVGDVNDAPDISSVSPGSMPEGEMVIYDADASDDEGDPVTLSLSGPDADLFTIDPVTGVVTFITPPDYENPSDTDGDNVYEFAVTASDGTSSSTENVSVTITDSNDIPTFSGGPTNFTADEGEQEVYDADASDVDGDPIAYSLSGTDADLFTIDLETGVVTFRSPPDYENPGDADGDNVYEFTVTASDGTTSTDENVTVTVNNINDSAPTFDNGSTASNTVNENQASAFHASASDAEGDSITFSLSGDDADLFTIDSVTGEVSFITEPDFEIPTDVDGNNIYEFIIIASDGTNSSTEAVSVRVENINDCPPVFISGSTSNAIEDQAFAYNTNAIDDDDDPLTYSISGTDAALFTIDTDTGVVSFIDAPDYENPHDADGDNVYEFTVTANDGTYTTERTVSVTVDNANDNVPVFSDSPSATVVENQNLAFTAHASDADGDVLSFSLSGADAAMFNIDAATGAVSFIDTPDYENPHDVNGDNAYEFTVIASDGENETEEHVIISVANANDIAPQFSSGSTANATEDQSAAYNANATDGDGDPVSFSISGTDAALFTIDTETGVVSFIDAPDFENPHDADDDNIYDFTVTASDGVNSSDQAVSVTVDNANDNAPVFSDSPSATVVENQNLAFTAHASDADGDVLSFSLSGADAAMFNIDPATGAVTFITAPDFENPHDVNGDNAYEFTVIASDGENETEEHVIISVANANDSAPQFSSGSTANATEDQSAAYNANATDGDGDPVSFSISGTDAALFTIDTETGVVSFIDAPDYENPHDADGDNVYDFTVTASDGVNSSDQTVSVTVDNANDNVPVFFGSPSASIDENETSAFDAHASDADGDVLSFSLSGADAALFNIDSVTGAVTFITAPDFESPADTGGDNVYEFTVNVSDGVNSVEEYVIITVDDINDNAPVFISGGAESHLENQTSAYNADATDADGDDITYSISGTDAALLTINPNNGVVSFIDPPDYENPSDANGDNVYEFIVTANDGNIDVDQSVSVTVTNTNDDAPSFNSDSSASLEEGQTVAYDADASDINNDPITYSLSGTDAALFTIDATTGVVSFITPPDFENPADAGGDNDYEVTVTANDGLFDAILDATITVTNINDNTPVFTSGSTATAGEGQTLAYNADASDADDDDVTYSISGTDAALFAIDATTGVVSFITAPDFETPNDADGGNDYEFTITASDGGQSTDQAVTVSVANINDNTPIFTSSGSASVDENETAAYNADASDADGDTVTYSISGTDAALFTIDAATGAVSFITAPDYENPADAGGDNEYDILVTASDGLITTGQAVTVTVANVNDNAPIFTSGSTATAGEGQTLAYNADASDADGDDVTYSISGTDAALFAIDATTGVVSFITAPDFETPNDADGGNDYEFTITASDGGQSTDQAVTVSVANINDNSPIFTSDGSASVNENETAAYSSIASDADGDTLTYSISGTDAALFTIDTATGAVSFITAPDFENPADAGGDNEYDILVTASDGLITTGQAVTVTVANVNDNAPIFTSGSTATAGEGQTLAYNADASDADGDDVTYSISGTDAALFAIDATTGVVSFITAPDFETPNDADGGNDYEFTITASDGGQSTDQAVTVSVANINDNSPIFTSDGSASVNENETAAYSSIASDADGDTLTYSISGTDAALFTIDTATGAVSFITAPDFENPADAGGDNEYSFQITASDGVHEISETVIVSVDDVLEPATIIDLSALSSGQGFIIQGDVAGDTAGRSISNAGDVNGDGYDDLIVGAEYGDDGNTRAGEAYVVFGGANGFGTTVTTDGNARQVIDLTSLSAAQGFIIQSDDSFGRVGHSVSSAGDINADGFDDLIVGGITEEAFVVFGGAGTFGNSVTSDGFDRQVIDLSNLTSDEGFIIQGDIADDQFGFRSSNAGDVNGDGFDDLIIAASGGDDGGNSAGEAYVIFGRDDGFGTIDVTNLTIQQGFIIQGDTGGDSAGHSVSSAGDINGDGYDDLIVGASYGDDGGTFAGEAYVVFGNDLGHGTLDGTGRPVIDLTNLSALQGFVVQGDNASDRAGQSVSSAGDINGDGYDDILIGAHTSSSSGVDAGDTYVLYGGDSAFGTTINGRQVIDATTLGAGQGFIIQGGTGDESGYSVSSAGDVNGDGYDDIIVGTYLADPLNNFAGGSYVVFGDANGFGTNISGRQILDLSTLTEHEGFVIAGSGSYDFAGRSVSYAGDVNGDGYDDIIVGAMYGDDGGSDAGEAYVIFGGQIGLDPNALIGTDGADTITGVGGADVIRTGAGDDTISVPDLGFADIDGGAGNDTLVLTGSNQTLDLTADSGIGLPAEMNSIEAIDLTGGGNNTLEIDALAVLDTSNDTSDGITTLTVNGDASTQVNISGWILQGNITVNSINYDSYIIGRARLLIESGIAVENPPPTVTLVTLTSTLGFIIQGDTDADNSGFSVSYAGDVNGDGLDDVIVGAIQGDDGGVDAGESYIVFGSSDGLGTIDSTGRQVIDLSNFDAPQGFIIQGDHSEDHAGVSVSSAGDINGDGLDDVIVGANIGDDAGNNAGEAYIVFGSRSGFGTIDGAGRQVVDLTTINAAQGFLIVGDYANDFLGLSVSSAGDFNGDGYDDLIVGGPGGNDGGNNAGEAYVIFGRAEGFGTESGGRQEIDLSSLDTSQGFVIQGDSQFDFLGLSVSSAGDVNGDGYDDVIVGADIGDDGGADAGEAYVVFGSENGFGVLDGYGRFVLDLSNLVAAQGFIIQGDETGDRAGHSVSSAGDINGDGFDDVIIGAHYGSDGGTDAGEAYVVFGSNTGFGTLDGAGREVVDLSNLSPSRGFIIQGDTDGDLVGYSVSSAGDINGDGYDDIIVGASLGDDYGTDAGEAYVLFGGANGFGVQDGYGRQVIDLSNIDGAQGFIILGDASLDHAGRSVSSAGDIDGDGYDDLIVGANYGDDGGPYAGESYVIYGDAFALHFVDQAIVGTSGANILIGSDGDDSITGGGGADVIRSSAGDDVILVSDLSFADIDGGHGSDTLLLTGNGQTLDLTASTGSALPAEINSIETIDLTGSGDNTLEIDALAVFDTSDDTSGGVTTLTVRGDVGDVVNIVDRGWTQSADITVDTITYQTFVIGNAQMLIEEGVTVGNPNSPASLIDVTNLSATQGFIIEGSSRLDELAYSVSSLGDVNGDGYDDVIVGGPEYSYGFGIVFVLFGGANGFGSTVTLNGIDRQVIDPFNMTPEQGFQIRTGYNDNNIGASVAAAGDVNGDGFDDIIVGAPNTRVVPYRVGAAYVILGGTDLDDTNVSNLRETPSLSFIGLRSGDAVGNAVSSAGDINGDGYDDVIIGAPGAESGGLNSGDVYVIFGRAQPTDGSPGTSSSVDFEDLDVTQGFLISGDSIGDLIGPAVSSAGDINGDGYDDLIIGTGRGDDGGTNAGEAYILFGRADGFSTSESSGRPRLDLTTFTSDRGFIIQGESDGDYVGYAVSSAGDINNDGYDDIIIGGYLGDDGGASAGEAYVVFGSSGGFGNAVTINGITRQVIDLATLSAAQGFVIQGDDAGDSAGVSVSSAGDVNGDGFADMIVGAHRGAGWEGEAYVLYGSANGFGVSVINNGHARQVLDLTGIATSEGFIIQGDAGGDRFGQAVSSAGDIDGDGYDDLIVGARYGDDGGDNTGEAYVIFGGPMAAGDADQTIVGTLGANSLTGSDGDDSITGNGGADVIRGGAGDDVISVADLSFIDIDGGSGSDTLSLTGSGQTLDLTASSGLALPAVINSIETIDLTGSGNNTLAIDALALFDTSNDTSSAITTLTVQGDVGDEVTILDWTVGGSTAVNSVFYDVYTDGNARLLVQQGVTVNNQPVTIDLTTIDDTQGFIIQGDAAGDWAGVSVSYAGDINGDGYDDMIIGASTGDDGGSDAGEAYIVFGSEGGFGANVTTDGYDRQVLDLTSIHPLNGFIIEGAFANGFAGHSVSAAGDVNSDGIDDVIVGATGSSEAYVIFGNTIFTGAIVSGRWVLDLGTLTGTQGFVIQGDNALDEAGGSVSSAGDINGDGYDDIIVGAFRGDDGGSDAGEAYVVFGGANGFGIADANGRQVIDLTNLDAAQGFIIQGDAPNDWLGHSVSSAGDINGDGYDDLIVGANRGDDGGSSAGEAYVLFGSAGGFGTASGTGRQVIDVTTLTATQGFIIQGEAGDQLGSSVSSAGDINGDGYDDIIVGAYYGDDGGSDAGEVYVVFGSASGFGASVGGRQVLDLATLTATQGFIIQGDATSDLTGRSISSAGDVNGDGYGDLIVDASNSDDAGVDAGQVYVLYGGADGFGTLDGTGRQVIDLSILDAPQGFIIQGDVGGDHAGISVSSAGDIDGDGYDDLIVGASRGDDGGTDAGEAYVIFGGQFANDDADQLIAGTSGANELIGSDGDDTITGNGGADVIRGGAGDDVISVADMTFADIDGGTGSDTLSLAGSGQTLDLAAISGSGLPAEINSIETIDLTGSGDNMLEIDARAVFDTSTDTSTGVTTLTVHGDAGDAVNFTGTGWTQGADTLVDTITYHTFINGNARLLIDLDVTVGGLDIPASVIDLTTLSATQGFIIQGDATRDQAGYSVSSAGDVNGDGFDDMIVGASHGGDGGVETGEAYIVFGSASGFGTTVTIGGYNRQVIDLTSLSAAQGFIVQGDEAGDRLGRAVSSAGDINGDGFDDLIVGANYGDDGGNLASEAYVIFGGSGGFGNAVAVNGYARQVIDVTSLSAAEGFIIQGDAGGDYAGRAVSSAGDVNGDGYDDMIVGAWGGNDGGSDAGQSYVVFGGAGGFGTSVTTAGFARQVIDLTSLSAAEGFIIQGDASHDRSGRSVSTAGDVNGDGYDDIIVGAVLGDDGGSASGEAYVVFGSAGGFGASVSGRQVIDLTSLSAAQGFIIQGDVAGDNAGSSVSTAGDINGDGFDDLIISAYRGDDGGTTAGEAYVVFGSADGFGSSVGSRQVIDTTSLTSTQGFIIQGDVAQDFLSISLSSAGDVNGDGFDDIILGAAYADDGGSLAGAAYVVFGSANGFGTTVTTGGHARQVIDLTDLTTVQGFIIQGDEASDLAGFSVSSAGDIDGDGYDDVIVGARQGDDGGTYAGEAYVIFGGPMAAGDAGQSIVGTSGANELTGSDGDDSITGNGGADAIRGGAGNDAISVADISFIDINGGMGRDTLSLTGSGQTLDLSASSGVGLPAVINSIEAINLTGSGNNTLEIDALAVFDTSNDTSGGVTTLTVRGNAGDAVNFTETGWTQGANTTVNSVIYESFTNGNARVLIEQGISVSDPSGSLGYSETRVLLDSLGSTSSDSGSTSGSGDLSSDGSGAGFEWNPLVLDYIDMPIMDEAIERPFWSSHSILNYVDADGRYYPEQFDVSSRALSSAVAPIDDQGAGENNAHDGMGYNETRVQLEPLVVTNLGSAGGFDLNQAVLAREEVAALMDSADMQPPLWALNTLPETMQLPVLDHHERPGFPDMVPPIMNVPMDDLGG